MDDLDWKGNYIRLVDYIFKTTEPKKAMEVLVSAGTDTNIAFQTGLELDAKYHQLFDLPL